MAIEFDFGDVGDQFDTGVTYPFLKLKVGDIARICILASLNKRLKMKSKGWAVGLVHWVEKMGFIHCLCKAETPQELDDIEKEGGRPEQCILCKAAQTSNLVRLPAKYAVTPVIRYRVDPKGEPILSGGGLQYGLELWKLANAKFRQIRKKAKEWGDLAIHDLELSCTETKYQNMDIDIKKDAVWVQKKDEVLKFWKEEADKYNLIDVLGQTFTAEALERRFAVLERRGTKIETPAVLNTADLFGTPKGETVPEIVSEKEVSELDKLIEDAPPAVVEKAVEETDFSEDLLKGL